MKSPDPAESINPSSVLTGCGTLAIAAGIIMAGYFTLVLGDNGAKFDTNYAPGATYHLLEKIFTTLKAIAFVLALLLCVVWHYAAQIQQRAAIAPRIKKAPAETTPSQAVEIVPDAEPAPVNPPSTTKPKIWVAE